MCKPEYSVQREQDVIALLEIILDMPQREGACIAGALLEATVSAEIVHSLVRWLATLKRKILDVSIEEAEKLAEAQVVEMMQGYLIRARVEEELHRMRN